MAFQGEMNILNIFIIDEIFLFTQQQKNLNNIKYSKTVSCSQFVQTNVHFNMVIDFCIQ